MLRVYSRLDRGGGGAHHTRAAVLHNATISTPAQTHASLARLTPKHSAQIKLNAGLLSSRPAHQGPVIRAWPPAAKKPSHRRRAIRISSF